MNDWNSEAIEIFVEATVIEDAVARGQFLEFNCGGDLELRALGDGSVICYSQSREAFDRLRSRGR